MQQPRSQSHKPQKQPPQGALVSAVITTDLPNSQEGKEGENSEINKLKSSLVAQRLRIRLPMQETRVRALVREDPTCRGATKPVCYNY